MLRFELAFERFVIVAVVALPHRQRRRVVRNGAVVDPSKCGRRRLDDPQERCTATETAHSGIAEFCHGSLARHLWINVRSRRFEHSPHAAIAGFCEMFWR